MKSIKWSAIKVNKFVSFMFAGGFAAVCNYSSRFLFDKWLPYEVAIVFAYLIGMAVAFILMRGKVFHRTDKKLMSQVIRFSIVNILSLLQTLLVSMLLNYYILPILKIEYYKEAIAHLFGVVVPVFVSYILHKKYTFR